LSEESDRLLPGVPATASATCCGNERGVMRADRTAIFPTTIRTVDVGTQYEQRCSKLIV
jgi:hypothetical protein